MNARLHRSLLAAALATLVGLAGYMLAWPVPFDPVVWEPPSAPALDGRHAVNNRLASVERLCESEVCRGFAPITSVQEHGGYLYLGSLEARGFARVEVP